MTVQLVMAKYPHIRIRLADFHGNCNYFTDSIASKLRISNVCSSEIIAFRREAKGLSIKNLTKVVNKWITII